MRRLVAGLGICVGIQAYHLVETKKELKSQISNQEAIIARITNDAVSRENALQDLLEERIGTLERDMDGLKFLFQPKKSRK